MRQCGRFFLALLVLSQLACNQQQLVAAKNHLNYIRSKKFEKQDIQIDDIRGVFWPEEISNGGEIGSEKIKYTEEGGKLIEKYNDTSNPEKAVIEKFLIDMKSWFKKIEVITGPREKYIAAYKESIGGDSDGENDDGGDDEDSDENAEEVERERLEKTARDQISLATYVFENEWKVKIKANDKKLAKSLTLSWDSAKEKVSGEFQEWLGYGEESFSFQEGCSKKVRDNIKYTEENGIYHFKVDEADGSFYNFHISRYKYGPGEEGEDLSKVYFSGSMDYWLSEKILERRGNVKMSGKVIQP